ncbi:uncharacterized protein PHACADRAFT_33526 [Phanerochaete carnosa HHB-10118-sp]|uniref:DUF8190 domain-containing protein n=1 Tax=Phanerochaete carnosa (strain HHB-10118-sp) TaxID=650164 RepID=K5VS23_PHACS|nr:uncharacterized protein PHACADRAFT_33526 [Phanerochaete carnosa HHB-10118-sp]EKM49349.1 hypothetical protein PHACADRAFT_33526 [Phanerochaete carnosa HHB-10118-sp]
MRRTRTSNTNHQNLTLEADQPAEPPLLPVEQILDDQCASIPPYKFNPLMQTFLLLQLPSNRDSRETNEVEVDIGVPPMAFLSDDGVSQGEVYRHVLQFRRDRDEAQFHHAPVKRIRLSELKSIYNSGNVNRQLALIQSRHRVDLDDRYTLAATDSNVALNASNGTLDFLLCVPRDPSLEALLPNTNCDLSFTWKLVANCWHRKFKAKHARLGYNAEGSLLYLGTARDDDVWLALAPKQFFLDEDNFEYAAPGTISGDPRLSFANYCRTVVFLAFIMHKHGVSDVTVEPSDTWNANLSTMNDLSGITNLV